MENNNQQIILEEVKQTKTQERNSTITKTADDQLSNNMKKSAAYFDVRVPFSNLKQTFENATGLEKFLMILVSPILLIGFFFIILFGIPGHLVEVLFKDTFRLCNSLNNGVGVVFSIAIAFLVGWIYCAIIMARFCYEAILFCYDVVMWIVAIKHHKFISIVFTR